MTALIQAQSAAAAGHTNCGNMSYKRVPLPGFRVAHKDGIITENEKYAV
jgi:hypothetical protein